MDAKSNGGMICRRFVAAAISAGILAALPLDAPASTSPADVVKVRTCAAVSARVDALSGDGPVFLRSYDGARGSGEPEMPALHTAAFVYDNALAVIALLGCGKPAQAARVGEALRIAVTTDTRLRNAYRAGRADAKALPNGWWGAKENRWIEDAYQQGSATGNVAWAGLAMLALYDTKPEARWHDAASKLADWIIANASSGDGSDGFDGGIEGFDASPRKVGWKSTEHNVDVFALCDSLSRITVDAPLREKWQKCTSSAWRFIEAQWDAADGHFVVGTLVDGRTPNRKNSGLDAQLWTQILPAAKGEWRRALAFVEREHAVPGGFDFNTDRDGLWLEGNAQAALVYRVLGRDAEADRLLATIAGQFGTGGLVYATREPRITTGLAISGDSPSADFYYYRLPHLGATAWAALAATKRNPFVLSQDAISPQK